MNTHICLLPMGGGGRLEERESGTGRKRVMVKEEREKDEGTEDKVTSNRVEKRSQREVGKEGETRMRENLA